MRFGLPVDAWSLVHRAHRDQGSLGPSRSGTFTSSDISLDGHLSADGKMVLLRGDVATRWGP